MWQTWGFRLWSGTLQGERTKVLLQPSETRLGLFDPSEGAVAVKEQDIELLLDDRELWVEFRGGGFRGLLGGLVSGQGGGGFFGLLLELLELEIDARQLLIDGVDAGAAGVDLSLVGLEEGGGLLDAVVDGLFLQCGETLLETLHAFLIGGIGCLLLRKLEEVTVEQLLGFGLALELV